MKNLLTLDDISEQVGIPSSTLSKWAREKTIKAFKLGKKWRIYQEDWVSFVEKEREAQLSPLSNLDQPTSELGGQVEF